MKVNVNVRAIVQIPARYSCENVIVAALDEAPRIGVFEDLRRHVGIWRRQRGWKVGLRLALSTVGLSFDLEREDVA